MTADDVPIDIATAAGALFAAQHPVTAEATLTDIDAQALAIRHQLEDLAPRVTATESAVAAIADTVNAIAANLDALIRRTNLPSGVAAGNAIQQILGHVEAIVKATDANPNT